MLTRDQLHRLIDVRPDDALAPIGAVAEKMTPAVYLSLLNAPEDDEPESEDERIAVEEARSQYLRGEYLSHEEMKRRRGL